MNLKALVLAAALASQGCSFLMTRSPEPMARTGLPCNTSSAPAWLDLTQAGLNGLTALLFASSETRGNDYGMSRAFAVTGAGMALVYGISSAYGFSKVGECTRMREAERRMYAPPAPYEWATPSQPSPPSQDEPPVDVEVHTDVLVRPRR